MLLSLFCFRGRMDFEKDLKERQIEIENIAQDISDYKYKICQLEQRKKILDNEVFQIKTALEYIRSKSV